MSSAVFFLLLAFALMALGSGVLWFLHREPRVTDDRSVDQFQRNLRALDPTQMRDRGRSSTRDD